MLDLHALLDIEDAVIKATSEIKASVRKAMQVGFPERDCLVKCHNRRDCVGTLKVNLFALKATIAKIEAELKGE